MFLPVVIASLLLGCRGDSTGDADDEAGDTATDTATDTSSSESSDESATTTTDDTTTDDTTTDDTTTDTTEDTTEDTTDTTEDTTDETTDTGGFEEGLACGALLGCVDECNGDAMCEQTCLDAASMTGSGEYDAVSQCIIDSGCMNQNCVEQQCASELFACFTGDLTCSETSACVEMCAGDEGCEASCFVSATPLAQAQGQGLQDCITDNQCADEQCIADNCNPELQACFGGMSDVLPCPLVAECVWDCEGNQACADACNASASPSAIDEAPPLLDCASMQNCNDLGCAEDACPDEWGVCLSGDATCSDLVACVQGCAGAGLCEYNCVTEASFMDQVLFGALAECVTDNQCVDEQCIADNCGMEVAACGL
jgi:hypothetical protein